MLIGWTFYYFRGWNTRLLSSNFQSHTQSEFEFHISILFKFHRQNWNSVNINFVDGNEYWKIPFTSQHSELQMNVLYSPQYIALTQTREPIQIDVLAPCIHRSVLIQSEEQILAVVHEFIRSRHLVDTLFNLLTGSSLNCKLL